MFKVISFTTFVNSGFKVLKCLKEPQEVTSFNAMNFAKIDQFEKGSSQSLHIASLAV